MGAPGGPKTGGRQKGTRNRTTSARYAAMAKVNEALNQLGEDSLSGMRLLQEVIRSKDCPLDIRIQCSGLLLSMRCHLHPSRSTSWKCRHRSLVTRRGNSSLSGGLYMATCQQVRTRNGITP